MGLILSQKVKMNWGASNRKHFTKLGYEFTKFGDEFEVNVNELTKGSTVKVDVKCDYCGSISQHPYRDFLTNIYGSTYCCKECSKHKRREYDENGDFVYVDIPYRNKEWLETEYIVKDREAQDIADECGINMRTMREWISIFGLTGTKRNTDHITKEILEDMYIKNKMSSLEIGKEFGICDGTVLNLLKKFGIKSRSTSEAVNIYLYEKGGIEKARKTQSTMENRIKSSCRQHGISVEDFKGFSTTEQHMARNNTYYKEWIRNVFKRDNYTCQCCGKRGGNLNAHHLYNFAEYEDLRYDTENGITLCEQCHLVNYPNSFHSIYGERNNTPEQIDEFIKNYREEAV